MNLNIDIATKYKLIVIFFLMLSSLICNYAWYAHLHEKHDNKPIMYLIITSWLIIFFEYLLVIPANRIGKFKAKLTLNQLYILSEIMLILTFIPFSIYYFNNKISKKFIISVVLVVIAGYIIRNDK